MESAVALDIRGIMQALQRAGSATRSSKTFDLRGELVALTNHYMKENSMVYSKCAGSGSANSPLEREVTWNQRTKGPRAPYTVTVMFKRAAPWDGRRGASDYACSCKRQGVFARSRPPVFGKLHMLKMRLKRLRQSPAARGRARRRHFADASSRQRL